MTSIAIELIHCMTSANLYVLMFQLKLTWN